MSWEAKMTPTAELLSGISDLSVVGFSFGREFRILKTTDGYEWAVAPQSETAAWEWVKASTFQAALASVAKAIQNGRKK